MGLVSVLKMMTLVFTATLLLPMISADDKPTREMYRLREPGSRRKTMEIIDLGTFLLTNSEDGRPKSMTPFYLSLFEARNELSSHSINNVELATNDFILAELNNDFAGSKAFSDNPVVVVRTNLLSQERIAANVDERKLTKRRSLRNGSVTGSKFEVNVNVTFDREPSPDASEVDESLKRIMKDLTYLVTNITATEDPELAYVFMAHREEISDFSEYPVVDPTVVEIQRDISENESNESMKWLIPVILALVVSTIIIAFFLVRRQRRRVQEANLKIQQDLAFLDEENNVFSYENSPTKSSTRKRQLDTLDPNSFDGEDSLSRYSTSQNSLDANSPFYGIASGVGSPTNRSSWSGTETVKASNAKIVPLSSKLTEIGSNSLFAFSEEDEDLLQQSSQDEEASQQRSETSNGSELDRIMNEEEGVASFSSNPRQDDGINTTEADTPTAKSTIASFFSTNFFSGESLSQFAGSTLTMQASNTTEAKKKKAASKNARSLSLSPRTERHFSPTSTRSRAKSENAGDDDSVDSVFDFLGHAPQRGNADQHQQALDNDSSQPANEGDVLDALAAAAVVETAAAGAEDATNKLISEEVATENIASTAAVSKSPKSSSKSCIGAEETNSSTSPVKATETSPSHAAAIDESTLEESTFAGESLSDAPGSFPRRHRRHAKSTTQDGTSTYQTNAMQPQDWSMTDGLSDDDTLSEQGMGAFGAFPKGGFRSPKSSQKKLEKASYPNSPSNQSRSSYSAGMNSNISKAESSQASASRQLINDLVWLSKKIAGVKQSANDSAPTEDSALGNLPQTEAEDDSLSCASQDVIPPPFRQDTPISQKSPKSSLTISAPASTNIVCRDCFAPPGKLNIVIHSTKDGPAVHEVKEGSCLEGSIYPGDLIISVDNTDTRAFTAAQLMKMMAEKSQMERKITVLHFEEADLTSNELSGA